MCLTTTTTPRTPASTGGWNPSTCPQPPSRRSSASSAPTTSGAKERNLCPPAPIDDAGRLTRPDPWELGRLWFITSKKFGSDEKTRRGFWKEKDNEFTAIRGDQWQQPAQRRPVYIGFKRTLEFYMNDGTKTDWLMHEYAMLHHSDGRLFLKVWYTITRKFLQVLTMHACK